ncbi:MAG: hypothetical protein ACREVK_04215 [Gammaproteobacteria bacterium]
MDNAGSGELPADQSTEPLPGQRAPLAAPVQPLEEVVGGKVDIARHTPAVIADAIVLDMSLQMSAGIGHHRRPAFGTEGSQPLAELLQLPLDPSAFAPHHKAPFAASPDIVRESKEIEGPGFVLATAALIQGLAAIGERDSRGKTG